MSEQNKASVPDGWRSEIYATFTGSSYGHTLGVKPSKSKGEGSPTFEVEYSSLNEGAHSLTTKPPSSNEKTHTVISIADDCASQLSNEDDASRSSPLSLLASPVASPSPPPSLPVSSNDSLSVSLSASAECGVPLSTQPGSSCPTETEEEDDVVMIIPPPPVMSSALLSSATSAQATDLPASVDFPASFSSVKKEKESDYIVDVCKDEDLQIESPPGLASSQSSSTKVLKEDSWRNKTTSNALSSSTHSLRRVSSGSSPSSESQLLPVRRFNVPEKLKKTILEEEDYVDTLAAIIERDYYPDIHRLRLMLRLQYAKDNEDEETIRKFQRELSRLSGTPLQGSSAGNTPNRGASLLLSQDTGLPFKDKEAGDHNKLSVDKFASVDEFLANYTSEDNASFNEIIEKAKEDKYNARYSWMEKVALEENEKNREIMKCTQAGKKHDSLMLTNHYEAKNPLMFYPHDVDYMQNHTQMAPQLHMKSLLLGEQLSIPQSESSMQEAKDSTKSQLRRQPNILRSNTRFTGNEQQNMMEEMDFLKRQRMAMLEAAKLDEITRDEMVVSGGGFVENQALVGSEGPYPGGGVPHPGISVGARYTPLSGGSRSHQFVSTPMLLPGVGADKSPVMTWGEIAASPLLLDDDTGNILGSVARKKGASSDANGLSSSKVDDGPLFKLPEPIQREKIARNLQTAASERLKMRKRNVRKERLQSMISGRRSESRSVKLEQQDSRIRQLAERSPLVEAVLKTRSDDIFGGATPSKAGNKRRRKPGGVDGTPYSIGSSTPLSVGRESPLPSNFNRRLDSSNDGLNSQSEAETEGSIDSLGVAYTTKHIFNPGKAQAP